VRPGCLILQIIIAGDRHEGVAAARE
jgi:hypothetical protein